MKKRCRIIYNPTSGREAMKNDLVDILNILERAGYETSAFKLLRNLIQLEMKLHVSHAMALI